MYKLYGKYIFCFVKSHSFAFHYQLQNHFHIIFKFTIKIHYSFYQIIHVTRKHFSFFSIIKSHARVEKMANAKYIRKDIFITC